jgi:hypothetical protein
MIWSHHGRSSVTKKLGDATASAPWIGQGKALHSALNFTAVPDLAVNILCQVKHPQPSVCLHRSSFVPTNRFYGHEMAVFGWFDLATYQLVIAFPLAFHARPRAVETVENCCRESFIQIPETPKRCMHNWFLGLAALQILVDQTLEKVMSERWASGGLRVSVKLKSTA